MSDEKPKVQTLKSLPEPPEIGFAVREYSGAEVYGAPPGLSYEEVRSTANWPEGFELEPIRKEEAIEDGSVVIIPGLFGGLSAYKVHRDKEGSLYGMSGEVWAGLEWAPDDRKSWICIGTGNLAAIKKLDVYHE